MRRTVKELRDTPKLPTQARRRSAGRLRELRPAPGDLRIVQDFVNTADLDAKTDELTSPQALADWLGLHALLPTGTEVDGALAAGESASRELGAAVDRTASAALLRARFEAGGDLRLEPVAPGIDGAIGRLLAIIAAAQRDGLWPRFKGCVNGSCCAAFYAYSTNRSGLWCRPRCGSRIRARDFRRWSPLSRREQAPRTSSSRAVTSAPSPRRSCPSPPATSNRSSFGCYTRSVSP